MTAAVRKTRAERQAEMVPEKREPTATERMQAVVRVRDLGQMIVAMPDGLAEKAAAYGGMPDGLAKQNIEKAVHAWLAQIAAEGAGVDVDAAWYSLKAKVIKEKLYNEYLRLRLQAERSFLQLAAEVEREAAVARRIWQRKQEAAKLRKQIEADEKALAAKKQRLAQLD